MRRLLIVAFHFPPIQGSSGVHRTLAFAKFLKDFGWDVTVLSAHPRAYNSYRDENNKMVPPHVEVVRAPAWDTARHFAIGGWYPRFLALPDRWRTWIGGGVRAARKIIRERKPTAIFSTFPIASAHRIALQLHESSGLPWIADFRDPMAQDGYPTEPEVWQAYADIEKQVFARASGITVTTAGTAEYYTQRYGAAINSKLRVIENGFDPDTFDAAPKPAAAPQRANGEKLLLLHSGIMYPKDRDPEPFLKALKRLHNEGSVSEQTLEVRFRASGHVDRYQELISSLGLGGIVQLVPSIPYEEAAAEMQGADALLLFQAQSCNRQIPAKAYEYMYARRPILAITDPEGDTGRLLKRVGANSIALLEDSDAIYAMLRDALPSIRAGAHSLPDMAQVDKLSRRNRTEELARLLDDVTR